MSPGRSKANERSICTTDRSGELNLSRFINTGQAIHDKFERSFNKFQERMRSNIRYERKLKGVPLSKQVSRMSEEKEDPSSERIFNHYEWLTPDSHHTSDFSKRVSRRSVPNPEELPQYDTQQLYFKYFGKATPFKCLFDISKSRPRSQSFSAEITPPQFQKVINGEVYMGAKNVPPIASFWHSSGRDLPPPCEMKKMNELTDYWRKSGKFIRNFHPAYDLLQQALKKRKSQQLQTKQKKVEQVNYCQERRYRMRNSQTKQINCY